MIQREATVGLPGVSVDVPAGTPSGPKVTETPTGLVVNAPATPPSGRTDPFADNTERWMLALNSGTVSPNRVTPGNTAPSEPTGPRREPAGASAASRRPSDAAGNAPMAVPGSSPSRTAGTGALPAGTRSYTVKPGDSIARIAEATYGSQVYYKALLEANPTVKPERLRPGMVLVLPDLTETKARGGQDDDSPRAAVDGATEYRVATGDSLARIATKLYGKADRWEAIYELNKDRIGADPARLKVGMVLRLPEPPKQQ
jgi:nucleoid-associated protein YgaU